MVLPLCQQGSGAEARCSPLTSQGIATWLEKPQEYIVGAVFAQTLKHSRTMTNRAAWPDPVMAYNRFGTPTSDAASHSGMARAAAWAAAPKIWMRMIGRKSAR